MAEFVVRHPRPKHASDAKLLEKVGAGVDVLIRVHGQHERWRGEVVRFVADAGLVELRPTGASVTIEFLAASAVEVLPYDLCDRSAAAQRTTVVQLARLGRRIARTT